MPGLNAFKNKSMIFALLCLPVSLMCGTANGGAHIEWQSFQTRNAIVHYQSMEDLRKFNKKIDQPIRDYGFKGLVPPSGSNELAEVISRKVDSLFERSQQILDMRKKIKKININVYHNKDQLRKTYERIYGSPCLIRAWYEYRFHTIFICIEDLHEGMLAHEMAHGIIDHYLKVRPPSATAEILARYVDSHLRE
jgi:hypothetical protein